MKNLVLTTGCNYSVDIYKRFFCSLYDTGFRGHIVLIAESRDLEKVKSIPKKYRANLIFLRHTHEPIHLQSYRYLLYLQVLQRLGKELHNFDKIFICDFRDVIFQKNIFDWPFPSTTSLYFAQEDKNIGDEPFNYNWLHKGFGKNVAESLRGKPILCSGTTFGATAAIGNYLHAMKALIRQLLDNGKRQFLINLPGLDQGIHNYLYYECYLKGKALQNHNIKCFKNGQGPIYTVGTSTPLVDEEGFLVDHEGKIMWCVHQFDRLSDSLLQSTLMHQKYNLLCTK